jgi:hypothetical protein
MGRRPHLLPWLAIALALAAEAAARGVAATAPPVPSRPPKSQSLLAMSWDFADGKLAGWSHKENTKLSLVDDDRRKVLRVESPFAPFGFAWITRQFSPHSTEGVSHVGFRVRGDGSGHTLQISLGAARPGVARPLYYTNVKQTTTLDFRGWRMVTLDLDQFITPPSGLREPDLAHVVFLQFMITAKDPRRPLDVVIADVRCFGLTPAELVANDLRRRQRQQIVADAGKTLVTMRKQLADLRRQVDVVARKGRFADVAKVYLAALAWSIDDVQRCLDAEELEIVAQARPLLADLGKRVADPRRLLDRVLDRPPREDDPYRAGENPYFQSVVAAARSMSGKETVWPKGRKGYRLVPNAWSFAGFGNNLFDAVWSITTPKSPLRHNPMLLANALDLVELIAHQHTQGDFNRDRTAIYGNDGNINRFCLAPALDAWWLLRRAYPDLLPAAKQADLEAGLRRLVDYQVRDYGLARLAAEAHVKFPAYPNMDVHHILIMEFAHRLWRDPLYARERDAFVKILDQASYPMGAFSYINTQNECFVYHHLDVVYSARYWKLSGNPLTLAMLRRTAPFYPYNVEPAGMPEYFTDACWKHYWGGGEPSGPDVIAAICDDPRNKKVADVCGQIWGYGHGYKSAIAAEFWKPMAAQPLPDGYTMFDTNVDGPRGRYGCWSFAGNGRNYGVGYQGKDTFVGAMITDSARRPLPLDAALQIVASEVRLNRIENHWNGGRYCSAVEKLTTAIGPDVASLAVRYTLSKPNWQHKLDELLPWDGTQEWYLSKTRLVGLVAIEATAAETRAGVIGRVRLGLGRKLEPDGPQSWKYGRMRVKIHEHNYAQVATRASETFYMDKPESYRSSEITLLDPLSVAAGANHNVRYAKGTRYWFLVEVFPDSSQPAQQIQRIEQGSAVGFSVREADRLIVVLHNPADAATIVALGLPPSTAAISLYDDNSGKGRAIGQRPASIDLAPQRHVLVVAEEAGRR